MLLHIHHLCLLLCLIMALKVTCLKKQEQYVIHRYGFMNLCRMQSNSCPSISTTIRVVTVTACISLISDRSIYSVVLHYTPFHRINISLKLCCLSSNLSNLLQLKLSKNVWKWPPLNFINYHLLLNFCHFNITLNISVQENKI